MSSEWRKSSYSGGASNACVECGTDAGAVLVRDTADRNGPSLGITAEAWTAFLSTL